MDTPLSGILPYLYSIGNQAKRQIYGLLGDPASFAGSVAQDLQTSQDERRKALTTLLSPGIFTTPQETAAAQNALTNEAMNLLGITVYHGSPHKFDRFDSSKIGTGEGAQAYGHGLYLADNPEVAKSYWKDATGTYDATRLGPPPPNGGLYKVDLPDAMVAKMLDWDKPLSQQAPEVQKALNSINPAASKTAEQIAAAQKAYEDANYLWMSRPNDLPKDVEERLAKSAGQAYEDWQQMAGFGDKKGAFIYNQLARGKPYSAGSEALRQAGIPGVRYLDQGSRGRVSPTAGGDWVAEAANGMRIGKFKTQAEAEAAMRSNATYNYVVFPGEEGLLNILERNGVPLQGLLGK